MKFLKSILLIAVIMPLTFSACKKEEDAPEPKFGDLAIMFNHVWGMNAVPIDINQKIFHPKTSDTITLTTFKYYVSNFEVKKAGGNWYKLEDYYHLVDLGDPSTYVLKFENLPEGDYNEIKFVMGVDSARNVGGPQTGDLDPANGMFWNFTDGYIMIKAEGLSPNSPTGTFTYHLGGFAGPDKLVEQKHQVLANTPAMVRESETPKFIINANPAKIWHHWGSVSVGHEVLIPGPDAHELGFEFQNAVLVSKVEN